MKLPKLSVYQITGQLNARSDSLQQLHEASQADDTLAILKHTIKKGWPNNIKELRSGNTSILDIPGRTCH